MKLSATRLKTYLTCPRQYRYRYVDEVPAVVTAPLVFGRVMHDVLHRLHAHQSQDAAQDLQSIFETFCILWHKALAAEQPLFQPGASSEECEVMARQMLAVHLRVSQSATSPLLLEFPFEAQAGEHQLAGILDRVDEGEAGLVVIDYKTGRRKPSPRDLDSDLQLTIYAFAVQQLFDLPVERVVIHQLREGLDMCSTRGEQHYHWLVEELLPLVAKSIEERRFAPQPGYWCRWCDYRELCAAQGLRVETDEERPALCNDDSVTQGQLLALKTLILQSGWSDAQVRDHLRERFACDALENLSRAQAVQWLRQLQRDERLKTRQCPSSLTNSI